MITLDDILLRLHDEVEVEDNRGGLISCFSGLEAERILEGKILHRREGQFIRICQDLRLSVGKIAELQRQVKWS